MTTHHDKGKNQDSRVLTQLIFILRYSWKCLVNESFVLSYINIVL